LGNVRRICLILDAVGDLLEQSTAILLLQKMRGVEHCHRRNPVKLLAIIGGQDPAVKSETLNINNGVMPAAR
jgi:hypothetical protein